MKNAAARGPSIALIASFAVFLATSGAQAQAANEGERAAQQQPESKRSELAWGAATQKITRPRLASEVIGTQVRNWKGEDLGKIEELILDVNNARVQYAVLSFDKGLFDFGDKLFAYPVQLFRQGTGDELILNVPRDMLERAPGFERSRWPNWNDPAYSRDLERHYGSMVKGQPRPNRLLYRASELIGADVTDKQGRQAGKMRDVVAHLGTGEVRYAVLEFDGSWGPAGKMLALPLQSFRIAPGGGENVVLQTPRQRLDMSRAFDEDRWPNFEDKAYRSGVDGVPGAPSAPPLESKEGQRR